MSKVFSDMQLSSMCLKLSLVWKSGMGLGQSLQNWKSDRELYPVMQELAQGEASGEKLYETMAATGRFPVYMTGLLETADAAGKTEETLEALSAYYLRKDRRARQVRAAVLYPSMLLVLMLGVVALILVKVMPVFASVYKQLGSELTGAAGAMLGVGNWLGRCAPVLCGLVGALLAAGLAVWFVPRFRAGFTAWFATAFSNRGVFRKLSEAKIAQCMQMGLAAGMTDAEAIGLAEKLVSDDRNASERCRKCVASLTESVAYDEPGMPWSMVMPLEYVEIMEFGRSSGALDAAMDEISERMQADAEQALDSVVSKIEPGIVIAASLLIGVILISVMLPLMDIIAVIG